MSGENGARPNTPARATSIFPFAGDDLLLGGIPARTLAERFGTPLYVYDAGVVEARYRELRSALPQRVAICYALKANPSLALSTLLARLGAGAEAASRGELLLAERAGFEPHSIVMAGPAKTAEDHLEAVRLGIRSIHVESEAEMIRLDSLAEAGRGPGRPVPIGLRVNTLEALEEERAIIGGAGPKKFGIDEEEIDPLIGRIRERRNLRLAGLHVFNASNVRDAASLVANASRILDLAARIAETLGRPLDYVDIGGGLGIPYAAGAGRLDLARLGEGIGALLAGRPGGDLGNTDLIVEPGRYLVGESGVYLCRVVETKVSRSRNYALVDGGIHHLLRPALIGEPHPVILASRARESSVRAYDIGGPLCTGLDFLAREAALPEVRPGDLVGVLCAGAYGYSESILEFLSHPAPPEVVVRDGEAGLSRPRVSPEERLAAQIVPPFLSGSPGRGGV